MQTVHKPKLWQVRIFSLNKKKECIGHVWVWRCGDGVVEGRGPTAQSAYKRWSSIRAKMESATWFTNVTLD